ncbi:hypothetical protein VTJ04DRAFT_7222 [Mycothermus thermophilus]|uniref:uncharacterized protein n=1 Tax=Humicola insolens TaxID=85995 RepID=UPI0037438E93
MYWFVGETTIESPKPVFLCICRLSGWRTFSTSSALHKHSVNHIYPSSASSQFVPPYVSWQGTETRKLNERDLHIIILT